MSSKERDILRKLQWGDYEKELNLIIINWDEPVTINCGGASKTYSKIECHF